MRWEKYNIHCIDIRCTIETVKFRHKFSLGMSNGLSPPPLVDAAVFGWRVIWI